MTIEQLEALTEYIDAAIDDRIESAFGRDGLVESIAKSDRLKDLKKSFGLEE